MALIKCSDCGSQISQEAKTCPKCGAPTLNGKLNALWWEIPLGILFLVIVGWIGDVAASRFLK